MGEEKTENKHANKELDVKHDFIAGSKFEDVNMQSSSFININLQKSRFHDINFSDVTFTAAQIGGTVFRHIGPPPDKDGKQARQRPVTFEEAMLCDSVFKKTDLSGVKIIECNLEGMTIDGIPVTDLISVYHAKSSKNTGG